MEWYDNNSLNLVKSFLKKRAKEAIVNALENPKNVKKKGLDSKDILID
jgi:hypothetical protein